jgi:hypothetical protein
MHNEAPLTGGVPVSVTFAMPIECETAATATLRAPTEAGRTPPPVYVEPERAISRRSLPAASPTAERPLLSPFGAAIWFKKLAWCLGPDLSPAIAGVLQAIAPPKQRKPPAGAALEQRRPAKQESPPPASEAAVRAAIAALGDGPEHKILPAVRRMLAGKTVSRQRFRDARGPRQPGRPAAHPSKNRRRI